MAGWGCAPQADLFEERAHRLLGDAGSPAAPRVALLDPPAGAQEVPPNLASLVLRGMQGTSPASLRLRPAAGGATTANLVGNVTCPDQGAGCYRFDLTAPLHPSTSYVVDWQSDPVGDGGSPAAPLVLGRVQTAALQDTVPPHLDSASLEPVADCVRVRLTADEPVTAQLVVADSDGIALGMGISQFDLAVRPGALAAGMVSALLQLTDRAGNQTSSSLIPLVVPPRGVGLVITEVQANPAGSELTQEFVELRNLTDQPQSLAGFVLEDSAGGDSLPGLVIPAGGFVLVVPATYNRDDPADPSPRPGTPLARVEGRLGKDGLSNTGEAVQLRAASGAVVSRYGGWVDVSATAWAGKSVHRIPTDDACDHPRQWTSRPTIPTPGW